VSSHDPFDSAGDPPDEGPGGPLDPVDEAFARYAPGRHRRKRQRRAIPGETISHLNLTPMMDIMTMLLVFLVKSFATEPENININLVRPPESTVEKVMEAATKVTVSKEAILVDDLQIITLAQLKVGDGTQASIPVLRDALLERADHLKALENKGGAPFDGKLLVVADEKTPYAVITSVLVTAGESKFSEYKLVVMQKGGGG
jgi:biopolymer transport protein ExbD